MSSYISHECAAFLARGDDDTVAVATVAIGVEVFAGFDKKSYGRHALPIRRNSINNGTVCARLATRFSEIHTTSARRLHDEQ